MKTELKNEAARKFEGFLKSGIKGLYTQGCDRLTAAGIDCDLRREPTEDNARHLLWTAQNRR